MTQARFVPSGIMQGLNLTNSDNQLGANLLRQLQQGPQVAMIWRVHASAACASHATRTSTRPRLVLLIRHSAVRTVYGCCLQLL